MQPHIYFGEFPPPHCNPIFTLEITDGAQKKGGREEWEGEEGKKDEEGEEVEEGGEYGKVRKRREERQGV